MLSNCKVYTTYLQFARGFSLCFTPPFRGGSELSYSTPVFSQCIKNFIEQLWLQKSKVYFLKCLREFLRFFALVPVTVWNLPHCLQVNSYAYDSFLHSLHIPLVTRLLIFPPHPIHHAPWRFRGSLSTLSPLLKCQLTNCFEMFNAFAISVSVSDGLNKTKSFIFAFTSPLFHVLVVT